MTERNQRPDSLEAELRALVPAEPSVGLRDRVGRALSAHAVPTRSVSARPARRWYVGGLAAAACVVAATVVWRVNRRETHVAVPIASTAPAPDTTGTVDDDLPALAVYRRALGDSPAALDQLLDRHAARSLGGGARGGTPSGRVTASSDFSLLR